MHKAILIATLLVLGSVAVAPTASAGHCQIFRDPPQACYVVEGAVHDAEDYLTCYQTKPIKQWSECF